MPEFEVCSWNESADDRECEGAQLRKRIAELKRERDTLADALRAARLALFLFTQRAGKSIKAIDRALGDE